MLSQVRALQVFWCINVPPSITSLTRHMPILRLLSTRGRHNLELADHRDYAEQANDPRQPRERVMGGGLAATVAREASAACHLRMPNASQWEKSMVALTGLCDLPFAIDSPA